MIAQSNEQWPWLVFCAALLLYVVAEALGLLGPRKRGKRGR